MKPLIEIISTDKEPNIIEQIMENKLNIQDSVMANITKNGYYVDSYMGVVVGFTKNGMIKVKSWKGVRCHSLSNIRKCG